MKIRIQGNSLRYRLKEPEVAALKSSGRITETTELGPGADEQLRFVLQLSAGSPAITVQHSGSTTIVTLPEATAYQWIDTDQVGMEAAVVVGTASPLKVLVEKDFKCLNGPEEENEGAYPNPMKHC